MWAIQVSVEDNRTNSHWHSRPFRRTGSGGLRQTVHKVFTSDRSSLYSRCLLVANLFTYLSRAVQQSIRECAERKMDGVQRSERNRDRREEVDFYVNSMLFFFIDRTKSWTDISHAQKKAQETHVHFYSWKRKHSLAMTHIDEFTSTVKTNTCEKRRFSFAAEALSGLP